ncbi:MAG: YjbQ family protein, partial [Methanomassiliicoccales archaeon]|nr:YjbQ family protein [Methanomassiliicoccales archaeon]
RTFPIRGGRLVKGTWQSIFLLELDGPRNRQVVVEIMGE